MTASAPHWRLSNGLPWAPADPDLLYSWTVGRPNVLTRSAPAGQPLTGLSDHWPTYAPTRLTGWPTTGRALDRTERHLVAPGLTSHPGSVARAQWDACLSSRGLPLTSSILMRTTCILCAARSSASSPDSHNVSTFCLSDYIILDTAACIVNSLLVLPSNSSMQNPITTAEQQQHVKPNN